MMTATVPSRPLALYPRQAAIFPSPCRQATLRIVKVFWGLSASLAYKRHFPAIDWLQSYSLYVDRLGSWFSDNVAPEWNELRAAGHAGAAGGGRAERNRAAGGHGRPEL